MKTSTGILIVKVGSVLEFLKSPKNPIKDISCGQKTTTLNFALGIETIA
jgi:hypothetical protein